MHGNRLGVDSKGPGSASTSPTIPTTKPPGSASGTPTPGSASGASGASDRPTSRVVPTIPATNSGLRPSYTPAGASGASATMQTSRPAEPNHKSYATGASPHTRPSAPPGSSSSTPTPSTTGAASQPPAAGSGTTGSHTHTGPHHHHHHHHIPYPRSTYMPEPARSSTPAGQTPTTSTGAKDPTRPESASATRPFTSEFPGFGIMRTAPRATDHQRRMQEAVDDRERQVERQRREEREAREARAKQATSPRASSTAPNPTSANPYPRPSLPPSPTNSRNLGAPTSASPVSSTKPSPSLPPTSAPATGSAQRPNLPLPSIGAIGARSLPSPFDPQAGRPPSSAAQPGHHRTGSNTSTGGRPDVPGSATTKVDPTRPGAPPPLRQPPATTAAPVLPGSGGINRPIGSRPDNPSVAGRYPGTNVGGPHSHEQDANRAGSAAAAAAASSSSTTTKPTTASGLPLGPNNRPPGRDYYGSNYPFSGGGNFMPFSGGFDYNSFSGWSSRRPMTDRERIAKEQRELQEERRKIAVEQEARLAREKKEANARREEELRKYRLDQQQKQQEELLHRRETAPPFTNAQTPYDNYVGRTAASSAAKVSTSNAALPTAGGPSTSATAGDTALQQVAPRREPRPYEYKTDSRDYQYTPRDKRPRMDAAVDDARRGNANKSRRRKDDDRPKSPVKARDLSHLTEPTKKYPDVHSTAVETWLKTVGELNRIVATEIYTGNTYRMSQQRSRHIAGGIVQVRIGGGFLGQRWKLRGEVGWDEAVSDPVYTDEEVGKGDGQVCAGWKERAIWGTDVYTDDSDLGLVLVHAGWVKWGGPLTTDTDSVVVDVRIVPPLARYFATERNGLRTRGWGNGHDGGSIVIEAVRRLPVDKKMMSGRKNRKSRMAEFALQRDHVFALDTPSTHSTAPIFSEPESADERRPLVELTRVNGIYEAIEPVLTFEQNRTAFQYSPEALEGVLIRNESPVSLWSKDLELDKGRDRYRLSLLPSSPRDPTLHLRLVHIILDSLNPKIDDRDPRAKKNRTVVFDSLPSSNLTWRKEGLIFWDPVEAEDKRQSAQTSGQEAKMCRVSGYRWVERDFDGWNERIRAAAEASMKALKAEMEAEQRRESEEKGESKGDAMEVDV